jgi:hypothetical protein
MITTKTRFARPAFLDLAVCVTGFICVLLLPPTQLNAQETRRYDFCDGDNNSFSVSRRGRQLVTHSALKERTLPGGRGVISVDGRQNGGVRVEGWDKNEVLVRACVHAAADTDAQARELAAQLRINTDNNQIFAEGPGNDEDRSWSVSYEVFVPRNSSIALKTHNGGIGVTNVQGRTRFEAVNGGVSFRLMGGSVRGQTTNGGLAIELDGDRWEGEGLDVRTTNGGVQMTIPENYSARLETATTNGRVRVDFPMTVQGRINKEIAVTLGSGGPTVRAVTTNGGVKIKRAGTE